MALDNKHLTLKDMVNWAMVTNSLNSINYDFSKCKIVCAKDGIDNKDDLFEEWDKVCEQLLPHIKSLRNMRIVASQK